MRNAEPSTTSRYRPIDASRGALDSELNGLSGLVGSAACLKYLAANSKPHPAVHGAAL